MRFIQSHIDSWLKEICVNEQLIISQYNSTIVLLIDRTTKYKLNLLIKEYCEMHEIKVTNFRKKIGDYVHNFKSFSK